jgi:hypothetical protein
LPHAPLADERGRIAPHPLRSDTLAASRWLRSGRHERLELVLVYRDAARSLTGKEIQRELASRLARCEAEPAVLEREQRGALLALLLVASELETALDDLAEGEHAAARASVRRFTDACAVAWWTGAVWDGPRWARELGAWSLPDSLMLKRAEGYAYYALDPAAYAIAAVEQAPLTGRVLVVGIRSIGTSLSAVVLASLRARGLEAERISVRPNGHAWDRRYTPDGSELARLRAFAGAPCFIVDEGPGLSGSTFLAVGEGLERAGLSRDSITFFTSHAADARRLVARDAERRWQRFRTLAVPDLAIDDALDLGAGRWRRCVYASEVEWPGCWTSAERRKFRSAGGSDLLKFEGLGPYADAPLARAEELARAGFTPSLYRARPGYLRQPWTEGEVLQRPFRACGLRSRLVPWLVEYLAFRSEVFRAPEAQPAALEEMARVNVAEAIGLELPRSFRLEVERWVYPDARLAPHEWLVSRTGELIKLDAVDHGDDHFFPGPCDPAWDLAGAIIELELSDGEAVELLDAYRRRTGDAIAARVPAHQIAYAAARVGSLSMAAASAEPLERERLVRDGAWYTARLRECLARCL